MALATLLLTQPFGLVLALGLALLTLAAGRLPARRHPSPASAPASPSPGSPTARLHPAVRAALDATLLLLGILLAWSTDPTGHILLALLTLGVGGVLIHALYRRADVAPRRRRLLVALRTCLWALLLIFLGRPACERTVVSWDKPVLPVLLDASVSMDLSDEPAGELTRAQRANAALADAKDTRARLAQLYDLRLRRIGARATATDTWEVVPTEPLTALAAALREAAEMRSARGRPAPTVIVLSDGAENAADAGAVRRAADELAAHHTALLAVGVGPEAGRTPLIELEPLAVPPRVGLRDVLPVRVAARAQGCRGQTVAIALLWDDEIAGTRDLSAEQSTQTLETTFQVVPPAPGVHRLLARVTLPDALGGHHFTTAALVDVVADRVRVLYLERVPHPESAFTVRVWRQDDRFEVTRQTLAAAGHDLPALPYDLFAGFDVVVLGRGTHKLSESALHALAQAVTARGVGLLLAGGRDALNGPLEQSPLTTLCPTELSTSPYGYTGECFFRPTEAGLRHPLLALAGARAAGEPNHPPTTQPTPWTDLPALSGVAALGPPKPAATVLARDQDDHPLLAAQEVGRGRCVVAAWESTWPWALLSDAGLELHRRLWTQLALWLANRRPSAWITTDQPTYPAAALASGERRVRIRAGLSGLEIAGAPAGKRAALAELRLRRGASSDPNEAAYPVPLTPTGAEWTAELTEQADARLGVGEYELEFTLRLAPGDDQPDSSPETHGANEFTARTRFAIEAQDLERRPPTANLGLLRAAADRTTASGGRYVELADLPAALADLAARDQRTRLALPVRYGLVEEDPWGLLAWAVVLLGTEWVLRKRYGLV